MNIRARRLLTIALIVGALPPIAFSAVPVPAAPGFDRIHVAIPWSEIGTKAGADYQGDGLAVSADGNGARLHCVFQRLEGEITREGLWLTSTVTNQAQDRFRVAATGVRRLHAMPETQKARGEVDFGFFVPPAPGQGTLPLSGSVAVDGRTVRFARPGLVEEYTVSMDGVRQDFVVLVRPAPALSPLNELRVDLSLDGATVEQTSYGAQLTLNESGRKIAYSRLKVTDANGSELPARMEVTEESKMAMAILVDDSKAVYPIRIDPTFSDANWVSMGGIRGANNQVIAAAADGLGNLYIGGDFSIVGEANASRVAKWNGTNWTALGGGVNGTVYSLAASGSDVYVGGIFTRATNSGGSAVSANYLARWNGTNWSTLGGGMNLYVYSLAAAGSEVYAGGAFTRATNSGGAAVPASRIAKWNGTSWSAVGAGVNGDVWAVALSGSNVYAGGSFMVATNTGGGAVSVSRVARWDGTNWSALGGGVSSLVYSMAVSGGNVYAGGGFTTATNSGGIAVPVSFIARWNGSSWSALGGGVNATINELTLAGDDLYAVGYFVRATNSGGVAVPAGRVAKWNGSSWSGLGAGIDSVLDAVAVVGTDVYVGGSFTTAGSATALRIAKWNGSSWSAVGTGVNDFINALAVSGGEVYAGGRFTMAGEVAANYIAKWNGSSWSALGAGVNNTVSALAVAGTNVYAGGNFTFATNTGGGALAVNRIARWDGVNWSALGGGVSDYVNDLTASGNDVYAGGQFVTATNSGGVTVTVNRIARWDGLQWSALGGGVNSTLYSVAVAGSDVYVGGSFTIATNSGGDAVTTQNIARWNGSNWSALGDGLNSSVYTLAGAGSNLYVGGAFSMATNTGGGSVAVNFIARWDGSNWNALGRGVNAQVAAVALAGGDVYVGGSFVRATNSGGAAIVVNYIAKWDGTNWSALGSGMDNQVFSLATGASDLYASGPFLLAGGKVSAYVAKAELNLTPPGYNQITAQLLGGSQMRLSYLGTAATSYALDRTFNLSAPITWDPQATNLTALDGTTVFTNTVVPTTNNFWRIRSLP